MKDPEENQPRRFVRPYGGAPDVAIVLDGLVVLNVTEAVEGQWLRAIALKDGGSAGFDGVWHVQHQLNGDVRILSGKDARGLPRGIVTMAGRLVSLILPQQDEPQPETP